jgi:hypothetical protein
MITDNPVYKSSMFALGGASCCLLMTGIVGTATTLIQWEGGSLAGKGYKMIKAEISSLVPIAKAALASLHYYFIRPSIAKMKAIDKFGYTFP